MSWYRRQFDQFWVRCQNCNCRAEFTFNSIKNRRKCPRCKLDNYHCIKPSRQKKVEK